MTASRASLACTAAVAAALGPPLALKAVAPDLALINESVSLPRGVYFLAPGAPLGRGAVVSAAPPASARDYLTVRGAPADLRLLKRVAATGGDRVCAGPAVVSLPDREVAVRRNDRRGVRLPAWRQCRRLGPQEVFLLGDSPASFDSRHFGPVRTADLTGPYLRILTW